LQLQEKNSKTCKALEKSSQVNKILVDVLSNGQLKILHGIISTEE
jgi:hypothetical protein